MEKQIKLSERDWSYRLIKYVFGVDPKIFRNFCPYFWLTVAGIFCFLPVACVRIITGPIKSFKEWWKYQSYSRYLDSLGKNEIYDLMVSPNYCEYYPGKESSEVLGDVMRRRKISLSQIEEYKGVWLKKKEKELKIFRAKEKSEKELKKRLQEIASFTKRASQWALAGLIVFCGYVLSTAGVNLVYLIGSASSDNLLGVLIVIAIPTLVFSLIGIFKLSWRLWEKKKGLWWGQYLYAVPVWIITSPIMIPAKVILCFLSWLWSIICSVGRGFRDGIIEFGGVFGEYLEASYKDYCPGIDWEKGEEK